MKPDPGTTMRSVRRTLDVLRALNMHNGARVSQLAHVTGISRPAIYRILDALVGLGYVHRRMDDERYDLTVQVRSLSEGYDEEYWIAAIALPEMTALQRLVVWPTDLATFFDDAMLVRETTRHASPLTIDQVHVGERLPLLTSATGRAYLAFCSAAEREAILKNLSASSRPQDSIARNGRLVSSLIANTRRDGFGYRHGELYPQTGAIAVPVMVGDRVIACLNITFSSSVLSVKEAASRYLAALQASAKEISRQLAAPAARAPSKAG
ncbi:MAG: IclR family transcriptional regulator C-terminal domain-containing protein [Lautropia sp.]